MPTLRDARALAVLAATGALLLAAFAAAPQADASTLYACVKKGGSVKVYAKAPKCKKHETKISWNSVGPAGKNGTNGSNGTNGKEGPAGQPQSAVAFNQDVEVEFVTEKFVTLFSLAGVTVRFQYTNALIADAVDLEASGPAGTRAISGMVDERANHKGEATESAQQLVYNVAVGTNTKFGGLVTNGKDEVDNAGHVTATITTPTAVIVIDANIEVGSHCVASGVAFSIPT
jgi:hypothetical protein